MATSRAAGRGPALRLSAFLLLFSVASAWAAVPAPRVLTPRSQGSAESKYGAGWQRGEAAAGAAAAARSLLQGKQRAPLPNFEIGVPAPPRRSFREWQSSVVRERRHELSSITFVAPGHPPLGYVALCVVARDAHADLLEWINHHVRLGVSKIYLWDHASQPPMQSVVKGYVGAGIVEYLPLPPDFQHASGKPQLFAYDQCLQRFGARHTWMGFIDVDEFLMFREPWPSVQSLPLFLSHFEGPAKPPQAHSGLGVHWIIFGSSGHVSRPHGGVLRSYHRCIKLRHAQHALVKTIVRTACTVSAESPHAFRHNCSQPVVQTDGSPMQGARSEEPVHKRLALHHYATKSRDEFALKMVRGSAMRRQRGWEYFAFIDEWSTEFNFDGLQLWDNAATFGHYPAITKEHLQRYQHEQHENFWLKGVDDPRYKEQQRQEAAAKEQVAVAAEAAKQQAAAGAQQQQQAGGGAAGAQQGVAAAAGGQQQAATVHAAVAAETQQAAAAAGEQLQSGTAAAQQDAAAASQQQGTAAAAGQQQAAQHDVGEFLGGEEHQAQAAAAALAGQQQQAAAAAGQQQQQQGAQTMQQAGAAAQQQQAGATTGGDLVAAGAGTGAGAATQR